MGHSCSKSARGNNASLVARGCRQLYFEAAEAAAVAAAVATAVAAASANHKEPTSPRKPRNTNGCFLEGSAVPARRTCRTCCPECFRFPCSTSNARGRWTGTAQRDFPCPGCTRRAAPASSLAACASGGGCNSPTRPCSRHTHAHSCAGKRACKCEQAHANTRAALQGKVPSHHPLPPLPPLVTGRRPLAHQQAADTYVENPSSFLKHQSTLGWALTRALLRM